MVYLAIAASDAKLPLFHHPKSFQDLMTLKEVYNGKTYDVDNLFENVYIYGKLKL